ncbi:hypothetical protein KAH43_08305 [Candidatus Bipolaricaulota bacterium]|nr:hypothetical protein [Candidatus Bipolaricaulota bacterium]
MQIRLSSDAGRHLVIDRSMLEDPRLSFRAKGLLAYLLAHPKTDLSNKRSLTSVSLEGMDAVNTALKELEEAGYFRRIQESNEDGSTRMFGIVYPASRIPVLEAQPVSENPSSQDSKSAPAEESAKKAATSTPAQRIVDHLNDLRKVAWDWARYTPISAKYAKNVEHINGRLADGYDEPDLLLVLEYLASVDGGKEDSRKYFDCVTPFNTKNFERNLTMARDWDAKGRRTVQTNRAFQRVEGHDPKIYEQRLTGGTT